jgi:UDP-N-acetyl-D-glucosamine dehydrogenase
MPAIPSATETAHRDRLADAIANRTAVIGQVGLGTTGLPLAQAFSAAGFRVVGIDNDPEAIRTAMETTLESPGFTTSSDYAILATVDCVLFSLPTSWEEDGSPNLRVLEQGWLDAVKYGQGKLFIVESTVVPGTSRHLLGQASERGLRSGVDFFAAYSPERIDTGNPVHGLKNTPKLVAGADETSRDLACALYREIADTVLPVSALEVAELAKVFENNFRFVNIALAMELAAVCRELNLDVFEVLDSSASKPFAFMRHTPTAGVGGTCIPMAPHYFRAASGQAETAITEAAISANKKRLETVVDVALGVCESSSAPSLLLIGAGYKPYTSDIRGSVAPLLAHRLLDTGAKVSFWDPVIESIGITEVNAVDILDASVVGGFDCIVVLQPVGPPDLPQAAGRTPIVDLTGSYDATLPNVFRA